MRKALLFLLLAGLGCSAGRARTGTAAREAIYGADDRLDYYASNDERWRALLRDSTVAMIDARYLDESNAANIAFLGPTHQQDLGLCPNQRFLTQTAAASCSGTLIDDDVILTAGHCLDVSESCRDYKFVFHFYMTSETERATVTSEDVFTCRRTLLHRVAPALQDVYPDFLIIQLDRPATPRHTPVRVKVADEPLERGESVVLLGYPDGIPGKISPNGIVQDSGEGALQIFDATTDSFDGNSGSGVFDALGQQVGILVSGNDDYVRDGSCYVAASYPASGCLAGGDGCPTNGSTGDELSIYAFNAIAALCSTGYPSPRLCAAYAVCGDGICAASETLASCPVDCASLPDPDGGPPTPHDAGTGATPRSGGCAAAGGGATTHAIWLLLALAFAVRHAGHRTFHRGRIAFRKGL